MAWVAPAVSVASMGISAYQGYQAGKGYERAGQQEQEARNSAAKLYNWNAKVAELQASDAIERARYEEARYREQVDQFIGTERAIQAASGTDVNFGSNVDVQADTARQGEIDALSIRLNGAREAWGFQVEAVDQRYRAVVAQRSGVQAAEAGRQQARAAYWATAGNLLGAGASLIQAKYGFGPRNADKNTRSPRLGSDPRVYG